MFTHPQAPLWICLCDSYSVPGLAYPPLDYLSCCRIRVCLSPGIRYLCPPTEIGGSHSLWFWHISIPSQVYLASPLVWVVVHAFTYTKELTPHPSPSASSSMYVPNQFWFCVYFYGFRFGSYLGTVTRLHSPEKLTNSSMWWGRPLMKSTIFSIML